MNRTRQLVGAAHRPGAVVLLLCAAAVLVALGMAVRGASSGTGFDHSVDGWLRSHVDAYTAMWFADLGNRAVLVLLAAAVAAACLALRTVRGAVLAIVGPFVAGSLADYVIKPLVGRSLHGYYAYPSGHTAGFGSLVLVVVVVMLGPVRRAAGDRVRRAVVAMALLLAVLCMLGLVASDYHYATDVIGGACLAVVSVLAVSLALDAIADLRRESECPTGRGRTAGTTWRAGIPRRPSRRSRSSRR